MDARKVMEGASWHDQGWVGALMEELSVCLRYRGRTLLPFQ
jgi:hypothetical protein